ncbi:uncharacterized protein BYT42DRAFT_552488 [Radiomyces spectabilis]|uniref:uncharacterized protein n=1 Tax=Radiomyces spectabilis TaxID=64574 RepID=UPI00221EED61|nr:uncharacterized protein BYT42DRAFT_552488 [Radiomyces spectabilis]KAI8393860.1 hypothetical protein BYT42DRAFT_552488 [Radiomyces spectabilis]
MGTMSIRKVLKLKSTKKPEQQRQQQQQQQYKTHSSSGSLASISTVSTSSVPQTPTSNGPLPEKRGVFRTLEPVWYYNLSQNPDSSSAHWTPFDDASQYTLESSYGRVLHKQLRESSLGPCTVHFETRPATSATHALSYKDRTTSSNERPSHHRFSTMSAAPRPPPKDHNHVILEMNKNVQRAVTPVWWYEQDWEDGSKGMSRFDNRNQVRLEALSDDRSKLVLTDEAFLQPFTVILDTQKSKDQKEELLGFIYLDPVTPMMNPYPVTNLPLSMDFGRKYEPYPEPYVNAADDELWSPLSRRSSI